MDIKVISWSKNGRRAQIVVLTDQNGKKHSRSVHVERRSGDIFVSSRMVKRLAKDGTVNEIQESFTLN